jgi:AGCS family alanine or glycine:cation symporter
MFSYGVHVTDNGKYNVQNPVLGVLMLFLYQGAENVSAGPGFTQSAMDSVFPGFGSYFVAIALFFFAFTTMLVLLYC